MKQRVNIYNNKKSEASGISQFSKFLSRRLFDRTDAAATAYLSWWLVRVAIFPLPFINFKELPPTKKHAPTKCSLATPIYLAIVRTQSSVANSLHKQYRFYPVPYCGRQLLLLRTRWKFTSRSKLYIEVSKIHAKWVVIANERNGHNHIAVCGYVILLLSHDSKYMSAYKSGFGRVALQQVGALIAP